MKAKRKTITMLVTVSVPKGLAADQARGAIRGALSAIFDGTDSEMPDVKLISVKSAAAILHAAEMARIAWGRPYHPKPSKRAGTPPLLEAMGEK